MRAVALVMPLSSAEAFAEAAAVEAFLNSKRGDKQLHPPVVAALLAHFAAKSISLRFLTANR